MTYAELAQAEKLGFQRMQTPAGRLLWRRQGRRMTIIFIKSGDQHEENLENEPRIDLPEEDDIPGNKAWAEILSESP